jgi:YD repeat-containing protein
MPQKTSDPTSFVDISARSVAKVSRRAFAHGNTELDYENAIGGACFDLPLALLSAARAEPWVSGDLLRDQLRGGEPHRVHCRCGAAANANTYAYDALDRLTSAVLPNLPFAYSYNAVGNRTPITAAANGGQATATVNVNAPPTVSLTAPANNSVFQAPATITITASASDAEVPDERPLYRLATKIDAHAARRQSFGGDEC